MKRRKKHLQKRHEHVAPSAPQVPDAPRPAQVDWSEPVEQRPGGYDIERNGVPGEVGPDEPEVDRRLEH